MPQLFVVHRVRVDAVRDTVHVLHHDWDRRTGKLGNKRIPDANAANVMGAHITNLNSPAVEQLTLYREVVLLGVRCVSV